MYHSKVEFYAPQLYSYLWLLPYCNTVPGSSNSYSYVFHCSKIPTRVL